MNFNFPDNGLLQFLAMRRFAEMAMQHENDDDDPRIRELDEDAAEEFARREREATFSSITSFEQTMLLDERSTRYITEEKYEEAYSLVKKQYNLGPQVHFASVLIKYYVTLMLTDRIEKAGKVRDELIVLLEEKFEKSPEDLAKYGDRLRKQKKHFEAILFYQIASQLCEKETCVPEALNTFQSCALGMKLSVVELLEKHKVPKSLIKKHIVPHLHKTAGRVEKLPCVIKKMIVLVQVHCLHHVEHCELLVDDLNARETTLKKAIELMKRHHGNEANKHSIYGGCLNNLGHTYLMKNRFSDAATYFGAAIAAKKKAQDYDSPAEKREDIQKSEIALQAVRRQL